MKARAQFQHPRQRMRLVGGDELRQEGQEEDRQFRIEDVDQDRGHDDAPAGARGAAGACRSTARPSRATPARPCRADRPRRTISAPRTPARWCAAPRPARAWRPAYAARSRACSRRPPRCSAARPASAPPPACRARRCRGSDHDQRGQQERQRHGPAIITASRSGVEAQRRRRSRTRPRLAAVGALPCAPSVPPRGSRRAAPMASPRTWTPSGNS